MDLKSPVSLEAAVGALVLSNEKIQPYMRAAADDSNFINDNLAETIKKPTGPAPIIGILGAKGGVGATTVAINLASAISDSFKTTLIDTNLQQPDIALMLGNQPKYHLGDLIGRREHLDKKLFAACCETISLPTGRLDFISPPLDLDKSLSIDLNLFLDCLETVKAFTELIVIDLPKQLDATLMGLIDQCDLLLVVLEPSLTGILAGKRWLTALDDLDYPVENLSIVINRSGGRMKHLEGEIKSTLPVSHQWKLPNAFATLEESSLSGEPAVTRLPRDGYSRAVKKIALAIGQVLDGRRG